jgi:hypothetical protein
MAELPWCGKDNVSQILEHYITKTWKVNGADSVKSMTKWAQPVKRGGSRRVADSGGWGCRWLLPAVGGYSALLEAG